MDDGPQRVLMAKADSKVAQRFNKPVASRRRERNGNKKATNITVRHYEYTIIIVLLSVDTVATRKLSFTTERGGNVVYRSSRRLSVWREKMERK